MQSRVSAILPQVHFSSSKFALALIQVSWGKDPTCSSARIITELIKFFIAVATLILAIAVATAGSEACDKFSAGMPLLLDMVPCFCSDSSDAVTIFKLYYLGFRA